MVVPIRGVILTKVLAAYFIPRPKQLFCGEVMPHTDYSVKKKLFIEEAM